MDTKNALRREENRRVLDQNGPFFARRRRNSSPNYRISLHVKDIRRKLANFGRFSLKILGPFLWLSPLRKRILAPLVWEISHGFV